MVMMMMAAATTGRIVTSLLRLWGEEEEEEVVAGGLGGGGVAVRIIVYLPSTSRWRSAERTCFVFSSFLSSPAARSGVLDHVPGSICSM